MDSRLSLHGKGHEVPFARPAEKSWIRLPRARVVMVAHAAQVVVLVLVACSGGRVGGSGLIRLIAARVATPHRLAIPTSVCITRALLASKGGTQDSGEEASAPAAAPFAALAPHVGPRV
jgi:hypothetical protein